MNEQPSERQVVEQLRSLLGTELAAFLLAASVEEVEGVASGRAEKLPSTEQSETAQATLTWISKNIDNLGPDARTALLHYSEEEQTSVAVAFHRMAGGPFPDVSSDDPVLSGLLTIARDVFPALLLPIEGYNAMTLGGGVFGGPLVGDVFQTLTMSVYRHPLFEELLAKIAGDDQLGPTLDTSEHEGPGWAAGGAVQSRLDPTNLLLGLIAAPANEMLCLGQDLEIEAYTSLVKDNLSQVRSLVDGETVETQIVVGLSGLRPPADAAIETPWGRIRRADSRQQLIQPSGVAADAVLTAPFPIQLKLLKDEDPDHDTAFADRVAEIQMRCPIAALLGTDHDPRVATAIAWSTLLLPFDSSPSASSPLRPSFPRPSAPELTADEAKALATWAARVDEHHQENVHVALRRLVSAVGERADPADALIDAVMAWENLLGTSEEVTFRVTAALSHLLEDDPEQRPSRRKALGKIYALRSKIVHGEAAEATKVQAASTEAIEVAVAVLRRLYSDRVELLRLQDGQTRSDQLLLGIT